MTRAHANLGLHVSFHAHLQAVSQSLPGVQQGVAEICGVRRKAPDTRQANVSKEAPNTYSKTTSLLGYQLPVIFCISKAPRNPGQEVELQGDFPRVSSANVQLKAGQCNPNSVKNANKDG